MGEVRHIGLQSMSTANGTIPVVFSEMLRNLLKDNGSKEKIDLSYRERRHISKAKMDQYEDVKYVEVGSSGETDFKVPFNERYIASLDVTYSLLASLYDVNSSRLVLFNVFENTEACIKGLSSFASRSKRGNLEARLIGMQNGQDTAMLDPIVSYIIKHKIPLVEASLFGNETRHIAIDSKQGMSFTVLINNVNYRPGELVSKMTMDQFRRTLMKAPSQK
ncbi:MAG: hypothetical protein QW814_01140 [Methanothrix sp.]